jgi:selenocysteine lyase/cysteine desulfurase
MLGHGSRHEDPSIVAAREQLASAENAEREAGRAVMQARAAVAESREHVKRLKDEAEEEYVFITSPLPYHWKVKGG